MLSRLHASSRAGLSGLHLASLASAAVFALGCGAMRADAAEHELRVLHHQAIQMSSRTDVGVSERVSFDAYGRHFDLSVAPNERIRRAITTPGSRTMPLEGTVEGVPGSWVRITRSPSGWRGMLYDGQELYAIEAAQDIAGSTDEALKATGTAPVIYRLADALLPADEVLSCEIAQADPDPPTAASAFKNLSGELHIQAAALAPMKQVRIGVVGDFEFSNLQTGASPEDTIISRMNIVDGIFSSQVGVKISLAPSVIFATSSDPFTKSKAADLLSEVRSYRRSSSTQMALGITHLMTGRDLDGDTVGIAYIGSVCQGSSASSLSEGRRSSLTAALVAAHELGHNFNAPHDGESGACVSTPQTFLMAPRLNGSDQFSACSIAQMTPTVNNASCLSAYIPPDIALDVTTPSSQATIGTAFTASFFVRATGDDSSLDVSVMAAIPAGLTLNSVTSAGATCTSGAGSASCSFGTMTAGDAREVDLNLTSTDAGSLVVNLTLSSTNDAIASNNSGAVNVTSSGTPPAPPPPPSGGGGGTTGTASGGGGGGGGSLDVVTLVTMLGLLSIAIRRRVRVRAN